eukprot:Hpha_TRINITY_DN16246_c1_g1::TRINITY_DN16246_c1_g1_i1::g.12988::m.12988
MSNLLRHVQFEVEPRPGAGGGPPGLETAAAVDCAHNGVVRENGVEGHREHKVSLSHHVRVSWPQPPRDKVRGHVPGQDKGGEGEELARAAAEAEQLRQELEQKSESISKLKKAGRDVKAERDALREEKSATEAKAAEALEESVQAAREEERQAVRDELEAEVQGLRDTLAAAQQEVECVEQLRKELDSAKSDLERKEESINKLKKAGRDVKAQRDRLREEKAAAEAQAAEGLEEAVKVARQESEAALGELRRELGQEREQEREAGQAEKSAAEARSAEALEESVRAAREEGRQELCDVQSARDELETQVQGLRDALASAKQAEQLAAELAVAESTTREELAEAEAVVERLREEASEAKADQDSRLETDQVAIEELRRELEQEKERVLAAKETESQADLLRKELEEARAAVQKNEEMVVKMKKAGRELKAERDRLRSEHEDAATAQETTRLEMEAMTAECREEIAAEQTKAKEATALFEERVRAAEAGNEALVAEKEAEREEALLSARQFEQQLSESKAAADEAVSQHCLVQKNLRDAEDACEALRDNLAAAEQELQTAREDTTAAVEEARLASERAKQASEEAAVFSAEVAAVREAGEATATLADKLQQELAARTADLDEAKAEMQQLMQAEASASAENAQHEAQRLFLEELVARTRTEQDEVESFSEIVARSGAPQVLASRATIAQLGVNVAEVEGRLHIAAEQNESAATMLSDHVAALCVQGQDLEMRLQLTLAELEAARKREVELKEEARARTRNALTAEVAWMAEPLVTAVGTPRGSPISPFPEKELQQPTPSGPALSPTSPAPDAADADICGTAEAVTETIDQNGGFSFDIKIDRRQTDERLAELEALVARQRAELAFAHRQIAVLRDELEGSRRSVSELDGLLSDERSRVSALRTELRQANERIELLVADLEVFAEAEHTRAAAVASQQAAFRALQAEEERDAARAELARAREAQADLSEQLAAAEDRAALHREAEEVVTDSLRDVEARLLAADEARQEAALRAAASSAAEREAKQRARETEELRVEAEAARRREQEQSDEQLRRMQSAVTQKDGEISRREQELLLTRQNLQATEALLRERDESFTHQQEVAARLQLEKESLQRESGEARSTAEAAGLAASESAGRARQLEADAQLARREAEHVRLEWGAAQRELVCEQQQCARLTSDLQAAESRAVDLLERMRKAEARAQSMRREKEEAMRNTPGQAEAARFESRLRALTEELSGQRDRVSALETEKQWWLQECETAKGDLAKLRSECTSQVDSEQDVLMGQLQHLQEELEEVTAKLRRTDAELSRERDARDMADDRVGALEQQLKLAAARSHQKTDCKELPIIAL